MAFLFHQRNFKRMRTSRKSALIDSIWIPAPQNGGQEFSAHFTIFG
ncbi:Uncharacterised protein [Vibrio cholerae]|nr:Uncharacterised protein [Vibrio cholerae]